MLSALESILHHVSVFDSVVVVVAKHRDGFEAKILEEHRAAVNSLTRQERKQLALRRQLLRNPNLTYLIPLITRPSTPAKIQED